MAKPSVAVVGAGYFSQFHYQAWQRLDVELVGVCDHDHARARAVAEQYRVAGVYTDTATMLDELRPTLLDIATPPATHLEFIKAAADRGIGAICQKPFTGSLQTAEQAVQIAEECATLLVVHENFRFQPWYGQIRSMLDEGLLGAPYQLTFRLRPGDGQGDDAYISRQPYFQKMQRFLVHETAVHFIDVFRFLFGEVQSVYARLVRLNPVIAGEDAGLIVFDFQGATRGLFDGNRLVDHPAHNRRLTMGEMIVEGSKAVLRLDGDGRLFIRSFEHNDENAVPYTWNDQGFGGDCVYRLQRHVLEHLSSGAPLMNQARDYLANLKVEAAIYESSETGRRIDL